MQFDSDRSNATVNSQTLEAKILKENSSQHGLYKFEPECSAGCNLIPIAAMQHTQSHCQINRTFDD